MVASLVTVSSVAIGFPVAWALAIMPKKLSAIIFAIIILSMWTNLLARTYAWMVLLQRTGLINKILMASGLISQPLPLVNNLTGVVIGMTYIMLPVFIIPTTAAIRELDPRVMQAAALCGASRSQAFTRIFLPLLSTSIASGALLIFVISLGYFITPALLGSSSHMMLGELIAQLIQSLVDWGMGGTAAFVLLVITTGLYVVQLKLMKSHREQRR
jgi:putative spermidine/putrescine transport system permease protein